MGGFRAVAVVFLNKHLLIESEKRAIPGLRNRAVPQFSSKTDFSEAIALTQNKINLPPWTPSWEIRHSGLDACLLLGLPDQRPDPGSLLGTVPFFHGLVCLQVSQPPMQGLMWRLGGFFQCTWIFLKCFSRKFGFKWKGRERVRIWCSLCLFASCLCFCSLQCLLLGGSGKIFFFPDWVWIFRIIKDPFLQHFEWGSFSLNIVLCS